MTFVPIPHVVDEQLIQSLWGNTVADDLAYLKAQIDAMQAAKRIVSYAMSWVTNESADNTGAATSTITTASVPVVANRVYDIATFSHGIWRTGTTGATVLTASLVVDGDTLSTSDISFVATNVPLQIGFRLLWKAPSTKTVVINLNMVKAWYSANPVRSYGGPDQPIGIVVTDFGLTP